MLRSCRNCKYDGSGEKDYPCCDCYFGEDSVDETPLRWTPKSKSEPTASSNVDHPSHYNQGGIECWDAMEATYGKEAVKTFCKLNAFKYVWRADSKNGMEDIDKAINYLTKFKELNDE